VKPAGVDAHTGVEDANGKKSPEAVAAFVTRAKEAFESL
jgi:phosphoribosylanthranilate isomerase